MPPSTILLVGGSLRTGSVNAAVLRTAVRIMPEGTRGRLYTGLAGLSHFNPDDDRTPLAREVAELRSSIDAADALMFCTPEYAGALPGAFKNLLDWTVGGVEMTRKPVGWINASSPAAPRGGEDAHASLRRVLGYIDATIVEEACVRLPLSRLEVGEDGLIGDLGRRAIIAAACGALARATTRFDDPADGAARQSVQA